MTSIVRFGRYQLLLIKSNNEVKSARECLSLLERLRVVLKNINQYRKVARQRRQLAQMPDYLLKDIGVTRADAMKEAEKPFWK